MMIDNFIYLSVGFLFGTAFWLTVGFTLMVKKKYFEEE